MEERTIKKTTLFMTKRLLLSRLFYHLPHLDRLRKTKGRVESSAINWIYGSTLFFFKSQKELEPTPPSLLHFTLNAVICLEKNSIWDSTHKSHMCEPFDSSFQRFCFNTYFASVGGKILWSGMKTAITSFVVILSLRVKSRIEQYALFS